MSIEDFALRFEGLDPAKINAIITNSEHLLGVVEAQMATVKQLTDTVQRLVAVVDAELPHAKQLVADVRSQLAAYEANQKRFSHF